MSRTLLAFAVAGLLAASAVPALAAHQSAGPAVKNEAAATVSFSARRHHRHYRRYSYRYYRAPYYRVAPYYAYAPRPYYYPQPYYRPYYRPFPFGFFPFY